MKLAFSTLATPDWSWDQILRLGPEYGYDGVEIRLLERETDLLSRDEFQPEVRGKRVQELKGANFSVCGLASSVRFDYPEVIERDAQVDIGKAYLDMAHDLEAGFVRVFGDKLPPETQQAVRREVIQNVAEGLDRLGAYGAEVGVRVIIETHGDFADTRVMQATLEQITSDHVGVLWDTHHPWRFFGETIVESFQRLQPWICHTHWKDSTTPLENSEDSKNLTPESSVAHALMSGHQHADYVLFGEGEFPAGEAMQLLRSSEYDGWYCLEWEKAWHPEIEAPEVALPLFPGQLRHIASQHDS